MQYTYVSLDPAFSVTKLVSLHYNEFPVGYCFHGERHPFWEIVYMDKGSAQIGADERITDLREGNILFHQPGEFHTIRAQGPSAPNILVAAFYCDDPLMDRFRGMSAELTNEEKRMLGRAVKYASEVFVGDKKDYYLSPVPRDDAPVWGLQQIRMELESLLISLAQRMHGAAAGCAESSRRPTAPLARLRYDTDMVRCVEEYMTAHIGESLRLRDICAHFRTTETTLKKMFRSVTGKGIMARFADIRIDAAKSLIREGHLNFSEIALMTGFSSIHYFSRRFRELTGMTPSEYSKSVKVEYER